MILSVFTAAYPAPLIKTDAASHMVATIVFIDSDFASRTFVYGAFAKSPISISGVNYIFTFLFAMVR